VFALTRLHGAATLSSDFRWIGNLFRGFDVAGQLQFHIDHRLHL
jgi:hypothetical protein